MQKKKPNLSDGLSTFAGYSNKQKIMKLIEIQTYSVPGQTHQEQIFVNADLIAYIQTNEHNQTFICFSNGARLEAKEGMASLKKKLQ